MIAFYIKGWNRAQEENKTLHTNLRMSNKEPDDMHLKHGTRDFLLLPSTDLLKLFLTRQWIAKVKSYVRPLQAEAVLSQKYSSAV